MQDFSKSGRAMGMGDGYAQKLKRNVKIVCSFYIGVPSVVQGSARITGGPEGARPP